MSFFRFHPSISLRPTPFLLTLKPTLPRLFTTTPICRIKEDANRTPEEVEQAKQDQLKEQKEGKGRWREDLASGGESNIKADKEGVSDHGEHMKELQKEGKERGEKGQL
jgi:hypothetical protein